MATRRDDALTTAASQPLPCPDWTDGKGNQESGPCPCHGGGSSLVTGAGVDHDYQGLLAASSPWSECYSRIIENVSEMRRTNVSPQNLFALPVNHADERVATARRAGGGRRLIGAGGSTLGRRGDGGFPVRGWELR